ncbi:amino acid adenylation domain-containing protein [Embleya sp. NBC_00888]|uniref:MupA/Atu3671 family FMN-dependent luciferase-like monooxygenase n=1 Tax=Embleya sp. NBC_00888 TaxID=2975960 RepID=UPI0038698462|nr:amino acid adenylation domain-containing protein [Embleya sp. NBC_00888]
MAGKQEAVFALVAEQLGQTTDELDVDRSFVASGADSLCLMAMSRILRTRFGVGVSVRELFTVTDTPRELARVVVGSLDSGTVPAARADAAEPRPAADPEPPSDPDSLDPAAADPVLAVLDAQLRVTEKMITKVTELAAEQLRMLDRMPPAHRSSARTPAPVAHRRTNDEVDPWTEDAPVELSPVGMETPDPSSPEEHPVQTPPVSGQTDFSLYFFGDYPEQDSTLGYRHLLDAATFADRNGFHALWIPERHFHSFGGLFPSPSVLAAAIAARTSRIRLHAGSVVLPLHDPIRVAEEWSVVDNLSGGRVGLGFAAGWQADDFVLAPENFGRHREIMYEHLQTFRRLWAGEAVQATSGSGALVDVRLHPRPVQSEPPLFAAVLSNPESYEKAARSGLGIVTNLMAQSVDDLRENIALYRRTRAQHGLDPATGRVVVLVHTCLGADSERVREQARVPFCGYLRSSLSLFDNVANSLGMDVDLAATPAEDLDFVIEQAYRRYCATRALIGSVDTCRPVLDAIRAAGADEIACFVDFGVPPDLMLAGLVPLAALRGEYASRRAVAPAAPVSSAPATPLQRRMWLLEEMHPGRRTYHEPKAILLEGYLDVDALRAALGRVVDRHRQLRTVFREIDGELRQVVLPTGSVDCPLVDLSGCGDEEAVLELRDSTAEAGIDLGTGPLLRCRIGRLGEDRHLLYVVAHHIVFDSLSTLIFCRDLAAFYRAGAREPVDLVDLGTWWDEVPAESADAAAGLDFWKRELAGTSPLQLPLDHPRSATPTSDGATQVHHLDAELAGRLRDFARERGCTLFMALLGAVGSVLGRFGAQQDIVLGAAVTHRPAGAEDLIGMFVETVAVRFDLSGDPGFDELTRRVRASVIRAMEHRDVPFDRVVDAVNPQRRPGVNPLFQVMVEFEQEAAPAFAGTGLTAELLDVPRTQAPFDLTFYLADRADGIRCTVEYDASLFERDTVLRVLEYVEELLRKATRTPDAGLSELPALTPRDASALERWQGEQTPASPACLHQLVEAQARTTPDVIALTGLGDPVTYRRLDASANRLAHSLSGLGVARGSRVGVCLSRGVPLITALLAVLKCGAAYVPLDPTLPAERRAFMLLDSGTGLLLADHTTGPDDHAGVSCPVQWIEDIDDDGPDTAPPTGTDPEDLAYCIYTSGSGGRPKAVAVPHRGPVNLVGWQLRRHEPMCTVQWASASFDASVQEIFTTLASGATLVLLDDRTRRDPGAVAEHLRRHGVQRISLPATPLRYLAGELIDVPSLREVLIGGEKLTLTQELRRLARECPEVALYNQYGPTETSVLVTSHRIDPATEPIPPIGRPVDNVRLRVVDEHGRPVPIGVVGELLIGGAAVAQGYFGDPERTAERFVDDGSGARSYRSGDLVCWRPDGCLRYIDRVDNQVKIRGFRVEPEEAERVLSRLDTVTEAAVLARPDQRGEHQLVAYVVLDPAARNGDWSTRLRKRLETTLPDYLIPQAWVPVDRLPMGANGKLDRSALLTTPVTRPDEPAEAAAEPLTDVERSVQKLWSVELGSAAIPADRSFFDVGGNSLSAVRLLERIRAELGRKIPMVDFLGSPTIRSLAQRLTERADAAGSSA